MPTTIDSPLPDPDWRDLRAGRHAALERLYRAHAPTLLRYGRQFARPEAVQDAVHDLFTRIWERRTTLSPDAQPRPYLLFSLRNALIRSGKRAERVTELTERAHARDDAPDAETRIVAEEHAEARQRTLRTALDALSPRERELVELRFHQGLDYDEACEVMGISYQSARNTLVRAFGKLRGRMGTNT